MTPVAAFVACAKEEHRAGHLFKNIGKILCAHDRCIERPPGRFAKQVLNHGLPEGDRATVADRHGKTLFDPHVGRGAVRGRNAGAEPFELGCHGFALARGQRTDRAEQRGAFGDDIVRRPGKDPPDRDHCRIEDRNLARDHCLDRRHDLAGNRHRIDRIMRHRGMAAPASNCHVQLVGRSEQGTGTPGEDAVRRIRHDVECKGCIGQRVDQAVVQHVTRAVMPFFARLEHEHDGSGKRVALRRKEPGGADEHGNMRIMAAGVHRPLGRRGIVEPGILMQRQGIHIATQQHSAPVVRSAQDRDQACRRWPFAEFQGQARERRLDLGQRLGILQTQLGLDMNGAAQCHEIGKDRFGIRRPAAGHLVHPRPPNNCRPARSSMISSDPPPIALTRTSR